MAKLKVVHYINQFFAQIGGEEKADYPVELRVGEIVGPGMALTQNFKDDAEDVYKRQVLGEMEPKSADDNFKAFIQNIFEKKVVSSVFLTGEGFEKNWYPDSLRVLCNGRRAFIGNNLYSKGACYTSMRKCRNYDDGPIYLDENRLTQQISLRDVYKRQV